MARILGRVFYALGLLGGDHLVEAQRADLVGEFLGQTAVKANELIDSAIGGVLFVDEAYSLSNSGYSKGDAYGDEALQVLLKRAEDNRDHLVVILAGYPEGMDRLLAANPGLSSRFTTRVDFPSLPAAGADRDRRGAGRRERGRAGTRRRSTSCGPSAGMSSTRAGSTSWATGGSCGRCTRRAARTGICGCRGIRALPTRDDLSTLRLPDLMQAYGEVLSGRGRGSGRSRRRLRGGPAAGSGRLRSGSAQPGLLGARAGSAGQPPPESRCPRFAPGPATRWAGSRTSPTSSLQDVLQGDQAQHPAGRRPRPGPGGWPRGA